MNLSYLLSQQILVIAMMIGFGFAAGKLKALTLESSVHMSKMVLYIISPCLMIDAFQVDFTRDKLIGFLLAIGAAVVIHVILLLVGAGLKRTGFNDIEQVSAIYTNCGNLLIPVITYVLGKEYVLFCCAYMCVQTVLIWTHGIGIIGGREYMNPKKIILNPNILAMAVGMILFFAQIRLPELVGAAVSRTADCVGPVSMFVIGIMIAYANLREVVGDKKTWLVALVRLIVCPMIVVLVMRLGHAYLLTPDAQKVLYVTFLAAAAPSASTVSQLANIHRNHAIQAGCINILTVLLCMVTMPLMTMVYQLLCMQR